MSHTDTPSMRMFENSRAPAAVGVQGAVPSASAGSGKKSNLARRERMRSSKRGDGWVAGGEAVGASTESVNDSLMQ